MKNRSHPRAPNIPALKCAIEANGILIDRRILATVEDLDTAVVLGFVFWIELITRPGKPKVVKPNAFWTPPRGCDTYSHWFNFKYADAVELLEHGISHTRLRSALKYLIQNLEILETRRQPNQFPSMVEYRINFDRLDLWMNIPRPEDYDVFQRSRPPKRKNAMPKIHPRSGKAHGWHKRYARMLANQRSIIRSKAVK